MRLGHIRSGLENRLWRGTRRAVHWQRSTTAENVRVQAGRMDIDG